MVDVTKGVSDNSAGGEEFEFVIVAVGGRLGIGRSGGGPAGRILTAEVRRREDI